MIILVETSTVMHTYYIYHLHLCYMYAVSKTNICYHSGCALVTCQSLRSQVCARLKAHWHHQGDLASRQSRRRRQDPLQLLIFQ